MSDEQNMSHTELVTSSEQSLIAQQSIRLAKRGLDLVEALRERIFRFPDDHAIGSLLLWDGYKIKNRFVAKGIVNVPGGSNIELDFQGRKEDFVFLSQLGANDIQKLKLKPWYKFGGEELRYLENLTGLLELDIIGKRITDAGLIYLRQLTQLHNLYLNGNLINGSGLENLKHLTNLEILDLGSNPIDDDNISHLAEFSNLKILRLAYTNITDNGIRYLQSLTKLKQLSLEGTRISEHGLMNLRPLKRLVQLNLRKTGLTDTSVAIIVTLDSLQELYLGKTNITDVGLNFLRTALPLCEIEDPEVGWI